MLFFFNVLLRWVSGLSFLSVTVTRRGILKKKKSDSYCPVLVFFIVALFKSHLSRHPCHNSCLFPSIFSLLNLFHCKVKNSILLFSTLLQDNTVNLFPEWSDFQRCSLLVASISIMGINKYSVPEECESIFQQTYTIL